MSEHVLQAGDSATIVVMHRDASMSTVKIEVDDLGTWGLIIDPNPAIPYSVIEPVAEDDNEGT
jgi:hypothetical protein